MKVEIEVELTTEQLAEGFCRLDDDAQAKFFVECARIARGWEHHREIQWLSIGKHLRECECSTEDARQMVDAINFGMAAPSPSQGGGET